MFYNEAGLASSKIVDVTCGKKDVDVVRLYQRTILSLLKPVPKREKVYTLLIITGLKACLLQDRPFSAR